MDVIVPKVRHNNGRKVENIIKEQERICAVTIPLIEQTAVYRKEREVTSEYNRRLRTCNDFLGMSGYRKLGCIYREGYITEKKGHTCEHVIPMATIVKMLINREITFQEAIFFPIALIKNSSDDQIKREGRVKSGFDKKFPFKRYDGLGINVFTWEGEYVDSHLWSMDDHWELIKRTPELSHIFCKINNESG